MSTAKEVKAEMFGDNPDPPVTTIVGRPLLAKLERHPLPLADLTTPVSMMLDRSPVRSLRRLQAHGSTSYPSIQRSARCSCGLSG